MKSNEFEGCKCPESSPNCSATEIDASSCKFFKGDNGKCLRHTGSHNCCSDKGVLRQMFGCSSEAKALTEKRKARLCHHVNTWKGKGLERFKTWQSHCCFKSKLARIIQVEGRKQLGIGWGDLKSPDCRGLTLEEIQRIDFSKIKFDELFEEVKAKTQAALEAKKSEIQSKISGLKSNPEQMSELIGKKINKFYKDARD
jgi:conjugal transfer mating pair stabilization protein TraN